jgi:ribosomal subunit interface protein
MKTAITAHQFDLTDALRTYVNQKLVQSIAPTVDDPATHVEITLNKQSSANAEDAMHCRIHLAVPGSTPIVVNKTASSMYAAIDMAHDVLLELVHIASGRSHDLHQARREAQKHRAEVARHVLTTRDDAVP